MVKLDSFGNITWTRSYGGPEDDSAFSVVETKDTGLALAGKTRSYGAGGADFWLVKTDSSGNREWSKTYGGPQDEGAVQVINTNDGGFAMTGWENSYGTGANDFWLVKTDADGNTQWSKTFGGQRDDIPFSIAQTKGDGYILAGESESYNLDGFSTNDADFFIVKTDSAGSEQWNKTFGGKHDNETSSLILSEDKAASIIQTSDGGYVFAGQTYTFDSNNIQGSASYDMCLIKIDTLGNEQWRETYGGLGTEEGFALIQCSDGGYAIIGYSDSYSGDQDFFLIKTDAVGAVPEYSFGSIVAIVIAVTVLAIVVQRRIKKTS